MIIILDETGILSLLYSLTIVVFVSVISIMLTNAIYVLCNSCFVSLIFGGQE